MDVAAFKEGQKTIWSLGEFADIAAMIRGASETILDKAAVSAGDTVLDVACGTGNLAIPAAQRGAIVTAIDITPKLVEICRAEAAAKGLDITIEEGDAEALEPADASFDKVISVFGMIFAPQHELAAAEMVRVAKPGGTVAITSWALDGMNGEMFKVIGQHMPPPPSDMKTPAMWGEESYIEEAFGGEIDWSFSRETVTFHAQSAAEWTAFMEEKLGPLVLAKSMLEPEGRFDALRDDLTAHYEKHNVADDGTFAGEASYILAVGVTPR
ncbi:MAG: class I SAM-dependent methyltransferase [Solirubrobacterales bacterium]